MEREPDTVRDAYGRTPVGQGLLLARRLVERGVKAVSVWMGGWDTHANNFGSLKTKLLPPLDQGFGMIMLAAARDCSNRGDGTKAAFRFSCNYRPFIDSLVVQESQQPFPPFEPGRLITWYSHDVEDGGAKNARIKMDNTRIVVTPDFVENWFIRDSDFRALNPSNPHSVEVWVVDRAGFVSDSSLVVTFDLPPLTSQSTRRP